MQSLTVERTEEHEAGQVPRHVALTFPRYYDWLAHFASYRRLLRAEKMALAIDLLSKLLVLADYLFARGVEVVTLDFLPRRVLELLDLDLSTLEDILLKLLYNIRKVSPRVYLIDSSGLIINLRFLPETSDKILNIVIGYDYKVELKYMLLKALNDNKLTELSLDNISELTKLREICREYLILKDDPDLVIVFGDEVFPNFLTFNLSYAELVFINKNMYEITLHDLDYALQEYRQRSRRFGR